MSERKPKAQPFENGSKNNVIRHALECAISDLHAKQNAIARRPDFWSNPLEESLARLPAEDRENFMKMDSYLRDFAKLQADIK